LNAKLITHGNVSGAGSESAILVPFGGNRGFALNVQTRVMVVTMLWRLGRNDGLVVLVGCERNFAGSRDLERSRIGSTSDNRDVSALDTFEQPRNKTLWSLEAAAVPAQCYHPSSNDHCIHSKLSIQSSSLRDQLDQPDAEHLHREHIARMISKMARKVARAAHSALHLLQSTP
jgi:hypothetical protein